ncbi:MAG: PAS domain-containing sensor histidine kinase [bacterium]
MNAASFFLPYDYVKIGIFVIDLDFNIVFWNKSLQEQSSLINTNLIGSNLFDKFPHLNNKVFKIRLKNVFEGGPPEFFSSQLNKHIIPILLPDNTYRTQHSTVIGVKIPSDSKTYAVFSISDITEEKKQIDNYKLMRDKAVFEVEERKKIEIKLQQTVLELEKNSEKLKAANVELVSLNASKDKFFSIIAHDLKNPLGAIMAYSEWLADEFDNLPKEEIFDSISSINGSSKNLYALLENLLNWSRLKTGRMEYEPEFISINAMFSNLKPLFDVSSINKNIKLNFNINDTIKLFADQNMIYTVLRNLISNSIKFTKRSGYVNIEAIKGINSIIISVTDNGIGMSEYQLVNVFNIESSFSTPGTEEEEGTGLGLILCKELVEKNNGVLKVISTLQKGSSFIMEFKGS